jgi:hypothetical protein
MGSVFGFPDDEKLIQREYANNVPFALSVARSTEQPDEPVSALGLKAPALKVDAFETSYASKGDYQEVAVLAQRRTKDLKVNYSVNGGRAKSDGVREWRGGEKYGQDGTNWYSEYRGRVENLKPGDKVEVWFTGKQFAGNGQGGGPGKAIESDRFTFTVAPDIDKDAKVLVLADEDIKGVNPRYPAGTAGPKYAQQYQDALKANGVKSAVWNMDTQGTPHHLGVLSHFKGVVWYLGDNRLTQGPEDEFVPVGPTAKYPDAQVADRELDTTVSVRDYLNEGGKLLYTGETTAYFGLLKQQIGAATNSTGGIYYGMNGDPSAPCKVTQGYDDCLFLSDDFAQFYLGLDDRLAYGGATGFAGSGGPFKGVNAGLPGTPANPVNEAGLLRPTSKERYPQLGATALGGYSGATGNPYGPVEGSKYIAFAHQDDAYARLTRTVDLTNVTAAQAATLQAQFSFDTEEDYDHLIVEAHTVGQDDWTTLPDKNGGTNTDFPVECFDTTNAEYYVAGHPFLRHYLTPEGCVNTGTTGAWNAFTGNSGGWKPVAFDLSAYAGKQVEISISYVSDPGTGGAGVFIDDTKVTTTGGVLDAEGFETGLGPWTLAGPPAGETSTAKYAWTDNAYGSAVGTGDTLTLGFGIEQLATPADRNRVMGSALKYLFG